VHLTLLYAFSRRVASQGRTTEFHPSVQETGPELTTGVEPRLVQVFIGVAPMLVANVDANKPKVATGDPMRLRGTQRG
jgi:hypothetical protein